MNASSAYSGLMTKPRWSQPSRAIKQESNLVIIAGKANKEAAINEGIWMWVKKEDLYMRSEAHSQLTL